MNRKITIFAFLATLNLSCSLYSNNINLDNQDRYNFNVSNKKGVTLYAKVTLNNFFNTKAISNGIKEKKYSDIKSLKVYLITSTSAVFPLNGDPLNSSNIMYQTNIDTTNPDNIIIKFNNVSGNTTTFGSGNYYHIAVRAFDDIGATGNELIKSNNGSSTAWTGTTAATNKTAVSSGTGIQIRTTDLALNSNNYFNVAPNLIDGKLINTNLFLKITEGYPSRIKSYKFNLCSDPLKPVSTKILPTSVIFNVSEDNLVGDNYHKFELANIPQGTSYATVEAYDNSNITGNNLVKQNNGYTPFSSPDSNSNIAVSKNSIIVDSNLIQSFSSGTFFEVDLNTNFYINTYSGSSSTGSFGGDSGQGTDANLNNPTGIAFDKAGNLYISDSSNHRIRKVTTSGVITTISGNGTGSFGGDSGQGTDANLNNPTGIAFDKLGNLYISDSSNHRIRKVTTSGVITTISGNGTGSFGGDSGQATDANLNNPTGIAFDKLGNLYISDSSNNRIRKVTTSGVITSIAGNGTGSFGGDSGQATDANLNNPTGIVFDKAGNLYISDSSNHRIRKIDTSGVITTIAGNGTASFSGDTLKATIATLNSPNRITLDNSGKIYISDTLNHRVRSLN